MLQIGVLCRKPVLLIPSVSRDIEFSEPGETDILINDLIDDFHLIQITFFVIFQYPSHLCTKFEVRTPFRSEDNYDAHPVSALFDLVTFDLETGSQYCPWGGQYSYQFWCF